MKFRGFTQSDRIRRIVAVARKEFFHILRDARSLAIVLLMPIVMLLLYGYAITFDIKRIDTAVVDQDRGRMSRSLIHSFVSSGYFKMKLGRPVPMETAISELRKGSITLVLVIPPRFESDLKRGRDVRLQVLADGADPNTSSVAIGYASQIAAGYSSSVLIDRVRSLGFDPSNVPSVTAEPRVWYNPELKSTHFIVPGLISVIMMLMSGLLTSLTIVREKESGTFEQLISTPVKPAELMAGKLMPYILIGLADVLIILVFGSLIFQVPFRGNLLALFFFTLEFIFCALGIGLLISASVKTQQAAVLGTVFATTLPSILLSGFVFPITSMPPILQALTYVIPARYFLTVLRTLFLKTGVGVSTLYPEAFFLFFFGMFFLFLASRRFKKKLE